MKGKKYVAMKLQLWRDIKALTPEPRDVQGDGKSIGMLLVYDSLLALHKDNPDCPYITVSPAPTHLDVKEGKK
jgi:hypothetical protein